MVVAKKYVLAKPFDGLPKDENIVLQEETLPALAAGDVLFEALCWSVDPYMRIIPIPTGSVMIGTQVAKVVESKDSNYAVGSLYVANFGWRTQTVVNPSQNKDYEIEAIGDLEGVSPSLALGAGGMPGGTAYLGLIEKGELKDGDTVVVSGAAGAVGSVVGQIAKLKKCTVIGFAGSEAKLKFLKEELGYTHAFNYKTCDISASIKSVAPDGANVYFDNVGGAMSNTILMNNMAPGGRMVCIGSISTYNDKEVATGPYPFFSIVLNQLSVRGLMYFALPTEDKERARKPLLAWIKEGKLKGKEHVTKGFDNMRQAFHGLFSGENIGKAIVMA